MKKGFVHVLLLALVLSLLFSGCGRAKEPTAADPSAQESTGAQEPTEAQEPTAAAEEVWRPAEEKDLQIALAVTAEEEAQGYETAYTPETAKAYLDQTLGGDVKACFNANGRALLLYWCGGGMHKSDYRVMRTLDHGKTWQTFAHVYTVSGGAATPVSDGTDYWVCGGSDETEEFFVAALPETMTELPAATFLRETVLSLVDPEGTARGIRNRLSEFRFDTEPGLLTLWLDVYVLEADDSYAEPVTVSLRFNRDCVLLDAEIE